MDYKLNYMKFSCVQVRVRVREYNSFETWDMFFLQTERAISFPSNQWVSASREDQDYSLTERPHRENSNTQGSAPGCLPSLQHSGISDVNLPHHPAHQKSFC